MTASSIRFSVCGVIAILALSFAGCDRLSLGSKLTLANYNKVSPGMSKTQVEQVLGKPTRVETKDMIIFKKSTWRYENGKDFAIVTFKNDEVDSKDTNMSSSP